jgi:hypothetical protein
MRKLMNKLIQLFVRVQVLALPSFASAEDSCVSVYQYATRDINIITKINQQLD